MRNKEATRYFSDLHEKSVCKALGGRQTPNSGAGYFDKGDVIIDTASLLCECKCSMDEKKSFSVKKEWIDGVKQNAFRGRLKNSCVCLNFKPNGENYYVIDETLMNLLVDKLGEENS